MAKREARDGEERDEGPRSLNCAGKGGRGAGE